MQRLYLNSEVHRKLPLGLMFFPGLYVSQNCRISSGVLITSFPVIVVYLLLQRRFLLGLTAGAMKG
jgi:raffinose/stachyose/melibiose transport system permease protein